MALNLTLAAETLPVGESQTLVIGSSRQTRGSIHQQLLSDQGNTSSRLSRGRIPSPASPGTEFQAQSLQIENSKLSAADSFAGCVPVFAFPNLTAVFGSHISEFRN